MIDLLVIRQKVYDSSIKMNVFPNLTSVLSKGNINVVSCKIDNY